MIKLVVADMDGTLLNDQKQLSPQFWEVEQALSDRDIIFAAASGRQYYNLRDLFDRISDRCIFVAENGTYVVYRDKVIHLDAMDREAANRFIQIGRGLPGADLILCGKNAAYVEKTNERFLAEARSYYKRLEIVSDLTLVDDDVLKVTLCDFNGSEAHCYPHFQAYETNFKVKVSGEIWLDITNVTAHKGAAIRMVQRDLGIRHEETVVFGDFLNDLEMMAEAKYSYAMKNAHPEILEAANFITRSDNNHNGVLETIVELLVLEGHAALVK